MISNNRNPNSTIRANTITVHSSNDLSISGSRLFDELSGGVFRGSWGNNVNYRIADVVTYKNEVLYCISDHTSHIFPRTSTWVTIKYPSVDIVDEHRNRKDNPHEVSKNQISLGNVENLPAGLFKTNGAFDNLSYVTPHDMMSILDAVIPVLGPSIVGLGNVDNFRSIRSFSPTSTTQMRRNDLFITNTFVQSWIHANKPMSTEHSSVGSLVKFRRGAVFFNWSGRFYTENFLYNTSNVRLNYTTIASENLGNNIPHPLNERMLVDAREYNGVCTLLCPNEAVNTHSEYVGTYSFDKFLTHKENIPGDEIYNSVCSSGNLLYFGTNSGKVVSFSSSMNKISEIYVSEDKLTVLGDAVVSNVPVIMCISLDGKIYAVDLNLNNVYVCDNHPVAMSVNSSFIGNSGAWNGAHHRSVGVHSGSGSILSYFLSLSVNHVGGLDVILCARVLTSPVIVGGKLEFSHNPVIRILTAPSTETSGITSTSRWFAGDIQRVEIKEIDGVLFPDRCTNAMSNSRLSRFPGVKIENSVAIYSPIVRDQPSTISYSSSMFGYNGLANQWSRHLDMYTQIYPEHNIIVESTSIRTYQHKAENSSIKQTILDITGNSKLKGYSTIFKDRSMIFARIREDRVLDIRYAKIPSFDTNTNHTNIASVRLSSFASPPP